MTRKALAETALVSIILAVVGGLVLTGVVVTMVNSGKERIDINACKANVATAVKAKQSVPIEQCFTNQAGVLAVEDERKYVDETSRQVAQLLHDCRYQFGESPDVPWAGGLLSSQTICFVCSTFQMPKVEGSANALTVPDFVAWMKSHNEKQGRTYADYLTPSLPWNDPQFVLMDSYNYDDNKGVFSGEFVPETPYAVVSFAVPQKRLIQGTGVQLSSDYWYLKGVKQLVTLDFQAAEGGTNWVFVTRGANLNKACSIQFTRYPANG